MVADAIESVGKEYIWKHDRARIVMVTTKPEPSDKRRRSRRRKRIKRGKDILIKLC
jgi:hypothetical protein